MIDLLVESWIWWSVVVFIAGCRYIARRMTLGSFKKYQADDYLMLVALSFYTALIVAINIVSNSTSNLLPPGFDVDSLTRQDIRDREYGSKLVLVVEQCQCATIWLVKGCLIILYLRLTTIRRENTIIKFLAGYIVVTFIVMDSLYLGYWCQPFSNYWAVPTPNRQCDAATNHLIMNAVFNLTSDIAMLAVGLPMFLRLMLPWKKKVPVILIFSLGVFTIVAAILNKVYSFSQPFGSQWTYWYTRESSTALLVANLPFIWTLWRRLLGMKSIDGESRQNSGGHGPALSKTNTAITNASKPTSPTKSRWVCSDNGTGEVEMEQMSRNGSMSLAEMLGTDMSAYTKDGAEPNEFTHPHLFYMRKKSVRLSTLSMENAVLKDTGERETVRRDSDERALHPTSTASSMRDGGGAESKKSLASLV